METGQEAEKQTDDATAKYDRKVRSGREKHRTKRCGGKFIDLHPRMDEYNPCRSWR